MLLGGGGLFTLGFLLGMLATGDGSGGVPSSQVRAADSEVIPLDLSVDGRPSTAFLVGEGGVALPRAAAPLSDAEPERVDARWSTLRQQIEVTIGAAIRGASERSKGKVNGSSSAVSVHVRPLESPDGELAIQASLAMRPASVLKLVTCASNLVCLGEDGTFQTPFEVTGRIDDRGTLQGNLIARAGGDPIWGGDDPQAAIDGFAARLAERLRAVGIERIDGALVLDEGSFAKPAPGPAWPSSNEYWKEHCALAGGFSVNAGCLTAVVRSTAKGSTAQSHLVPAGYGLPRRGSVTTGAPRTQLDIRIGATTTAATLRGSIPEKQGTWRARFSHPQPVIHFGGALRESLAAHGITIRDGIDRQRNAAAGQKLCVIRSSMVDTFESILLDSNNSLADQLFLATGHQIADAGTREAGARAARAALQSLGVDSEGFVQVDGSGLSRDNRLSARQVTALLAAVDGVGGEVSSLFRGSLALSGESGNLSRRMRSGPARGRIRAKTGFIGGTSTLAGYATTLAGERLSFAILVDYPRFDGLNTHCFKPMGDSICDAIVEMPLGSGQ